MSPGVWDAFVAYKQEGEELELDPDAIPEYVLDIADSVAKYEDEIRQAWEDFKESPTEQTAEDFKIIMLALVGIYWPVLFRTLTRTEDADFNPNHINYLRREMGQQLNYIEDSLLPDVKRGMLDQETGIVVDDELSKFDHRATVMYAGALWSFGYLTQVTWDGPDLRDQQDMFVMVGPRDGATCTGPRGCINFVGRAYTVAEIEANNIVPGRFKCLHNCRHIMVGLASLSQESQAELLASRLEQG